MTERVTFINIIFVLNDLAYFQALKEDLMLRGTAKIGEDTEYKKISDLNINIPDDVIEDIKVLAGSEYRNVVYLGIDEKRYFYVMITTL